MNKLIDYSGAAIRTFRKSEDRQKSKLSRAGYAVERVPATAPSQHAKASRPIAVDNDENFFESTNEDVSMDSQRYRLVRQFVCKGQVQGFLDRNSFDDVIEEEGIDFEKLEARVKRLSSSGTLTVKTYIKLAAPALLGRRGKVRTREKGYQKSSSPNPKAMVFTITGCVTKLSPIKAELEWFGGETLEISRECMLGNWESLNLGDWFKAVILRIPNGEVTQAILQSKILPPRYLSKSELEEVYSKIRPAELTSMD